MNIKNDKALAGIDMVIAIIAIFIFSTLMFSLTYSNALENVKLKQENLAIIYLTEIFENIGIEDYESIPTGEYLDIGTNNYDEYGTIENLVPDDVKENFIVDMIIEELFNEHDEYDKIIKKIQAKVTYVAGNKNYTCSMERLKIKE